MLNELAKTYAAQPKGAQCKRRHESNAAVLANPNARSEYANFADRAGYAIGSTHTTVNTRKTKSTGMFSPVFPS
jgi:hypothetical protein